MIKTAFSTVFQEKFVCIFFPFPHFPDGATSRAPVPTLTFALAMVVAGVGVSEGLGVRTGERVVGWKVKGMMGMVSQGLGCSAGKVGHRWGAENGQFGYAIQRGGHWGLSEDRNRERNGVPLKRCEKEG